MSLQFQNEHLISMNKNFALWLLFLLPPICSLSQSKPFFATFEGTVYKIPPSHLNSKFAYSDKVLAYEKIDSISWKEINFPDSQDSIPFPGVSVKKAFAIIFKSTMYIPQSGTYGFTLNSDDGSALWIEDTKVVDNEYPHGMRAKAGKRFLKKGSYPITIWYFQAYPFRYGLEFTYKFLKASADIDTIKTTKTYTLNNEALHFSTNSYRISEKGTASLEALASNLSEDIKEITIIGHTDSVGQEDANLALSANRAIAVSNKLRSLLLNKNIPFSIFGKGEQSPITSNETEGGRQQNRRVEVIIK